MARRGGALGVVAVRAARRETGGTGTHEGAYGAWVLTGGGGVADGGVPPVALFGAARRVASPSLWRGLCGDSAVQRGSWGGGASAGEVLGGGEGSERRRPQSGGAAARSCRRGRVLDLPRPAWVTFSQLRAPKRMRFSPPCAKMQILQVL